MGEDVCLKNDCGDAALGDTGVVLQGRLADGGHAFLLFVGGV